MTAKALTTEQRQALFVLRESLGGISEEKRQTQKRMVGTRKAIRAALACGAATVPQLAERTGIAAHEVLWHVTAMRKYGGVQESGEEGDYPLYALAAENQAIETR